MIKTFLSLFLGISLAGGCAPTVTTDDAVTFLRLQLMQAPPGLSDSGWSAEYAGQQDGYHLMKVHWSNFMTPAMIWEGAFHEETRRCPAAALPEGYPRDLARDLAAQRPRYWNDQLKPTTYYQFPKPDIADKAIREYLRKHGKLTPELEAVLERKPRYSAKPAEIRY